ncbi:MAG: hypothetical protein JNN07_17290 [Verrucomicrobiales bacterium]|nr:hypothetical protein [Verrucomicrobiales bacterium]
MKIIIWFCLVAMMAGCTSNRSPKINASTIPWNDRIGTYTFEESLNDLGKPALVSESDAGTSAEWILKRGARMSLGLGVGSFGRHSGVGVGTGVPLPAHGEYLRLRFGKDGKLMEWAKTKY